MSENAPRYTDAPSLVAAPATAAILARNEALIERCLETKRPVFRQIENIIPGYLLWCNEIFQRALGEACYGQLLVDLLTRITRLIRRVGRISGPEAAVDQMLNRSYVGIDFAIECTNRDGEAQLGIFDDSEEEDAFEMAYVEWKNGNGSGGKVRSNTG